MTSPTETTYQEFQYAYDWFNQHLFNGKLPPCLITLQREKQAYSYFSSNRFVSSLGDKTDEIALNPVYFSICPPEETMQTLVHEMCHLWQFHFGKPGRRGYHNKEWGNKMETIGLMPSSTGKEGGKKTGDKVADYIIIGGEFEKQCNDLFSTGFKITWSDKYPARNKILEAIESGTIEDMQEQLEEWGVEVTENGEIIIESQSKPTRFKYLCPECNSQVWGKSNLNIICGNCNKKLDQFEL